jgi:cation transporter-like permease
MWWRIGWSSALAGMVAIFVGSLVAGFIVPQAPGGHYQRLILQSMIARYANYVRDGDVLRAEAMKQLLTRAGIDPDAMRSA